MQRMSHEFFKEECVKKIVHGDIFTYKNPVITIKTKGRAYGGLSRKAVEMGIKLPEVPLGIAVFQDPYIFVALWDDESTYSHQHLYACAASVMRIAVVNDVKLIAMPPLGGKKERMQHLWVVEMGLFEAADVLDNAGFQIPEHTYVIM